MKKVKKFLYTKKYLYIVAKVDFYLRCQEGRNFELKAGTYCFEKEDIVFTKHDSLVSLIHIEVEYEDNGAKDIIEISQDDTMDYSTIKERNIDYRNIQFKPTINKEEVIGDKGLNDFAMQGIMSTTTLPQSSSDNYDKDINKKAELKNHDIMALTSKDNDTVSFMDSQGNVRTAYSGEFLQCETADNTNYKWNSIGARTRHELDEQVDKNTENIAQNTENIEENTTSIEKNKTAINNLEADISRFLSTLLRDRVRQFRSLPIENGDEHTDDVEDGVIVQYIGETNDKYTQGFFYRCKDLNRTEGVRFEWTKVDVIEEQANILHGYVNYIPDESERVWDTLYITEDNFVIDKTLKNYKRIVGLGDTMRTVCVEWLVSGIDTVFSNCTNIENLNIKIKRGGLIFIDKGTGRAVVNCNLTNVFNNCVNINNCAITLTAEDCFIQTKGGQNIFNSCTNINDCEVDVKEVKGSNGSATNTNLVAMNRCTHITNCNIRITTCECFYKIKGVYNSLDISKTTVYINKCYDCSLHGFDSCTKVINSRVEVSDFGYGGDKAWVENQVPSFYGFLYCTYCDGCTAISTSYRKHKGLVSPISTTSSQNPKKLTWTTAISTLGGTDITGSITPQIDGITYTAKDSINGTTSEGQQIHEITVIPSYDTSTATDYTAGALFNEDIETLKLTLPIVLSGGTSLTITQNLLPSNTVCKRVGFYNCSHLTTCLSSWHKTGFENCFDLYACKTEGEYKYGFNTCRYMTECENKKAGYQPQIYTDNDCPKGYFQCRHLTSCDSSYVDSAYGYQQCYSVKECLATGTSTKAKFYQSYSSPSVQSTYVCANTFNGGWNEV